MRRPMAKKVLAASMAAAMTMSVAACGGKATPAAPAESAAAPEVKEEVAASTEEVVEEEEEVSPYTVIIDDATGKPVDLGGMEIIIRDWWTGDPVEPRNEYEEARQEYRDWVQETYNFTVKEMKISEWGDVPQHFIDYVTTNGDDNNYVFTLDSRSASAMGQGLMYDLSTLDCLDFTEKKFTSNKNHELYSLGDSIYAMGSGSSEPRTGIWFNKRLLEEAGIDYKSIYEMQDNGTWDWPAFEKLLDQVQRDTDNDGVIDVWGMSLNESVLTNQAVWANNGEYVGMENGEYVYKLEDANTLYALNWANEIFAKYDEPAPEGSEWDYYKEQVNNGECVFFPEDSYAGTSGNILCDAEDDFGFVMFPKGPEATTYVNFWANNIYAIPSCYSEDRAWKIAFAYNAWTDTAWPAGYEDYVDYSNLYAGKFDEDSVKTYAMMQEPEHGMITYHAMIPDIKLGDDLTYKIGGTAVISELVEAVSESWRTYVDEVNAKNKN